MFKACILFGVMISVVSQRRKPPSRQTEFSPEPPPVKRNETEIFFAEVIYNHSRYCSSDRVCEDPVKSKCSKCFECECDSACSYYGDCCPDLALRLPKVNQTHEWSCVTSLVEMLYPSEIFQSKVPQTTKYYMVASCPSSDEDLRAMCSNSTTLGPVTSSDNVTTFTNKYCALCHNVTDTRNWKMSVECHSDTYYSEEFSSLSHLLNVSVHHPNCSVTFKAPRGVIPRACYSGQVETITKCNVTGKWTQYDKFVERACLSYKTIKEVDNIYYNNPFCYICNTEHPEVILREKCKRHNVINTPSFTALLDFSDVLYDNKDDIIAGCPKATVYDEQKKKCRKVSCSPGRELKNQTCLPIAEETSGMAYSLYFGLDLDEEIRKSDSDYGWNDVESAVEGFIYHVLLKQLVLFHDVTFAFKSLPTSPGHKCSNYSKQMFFSANLVTNVPVHQDDFEQLLLSLRNTTFVYLFNTKNVTFSTSVSEEAEKLLDTDTRGSHGNSCISIKAHLRGSTPEDISEYTPVNSLLMCPQIVLEPDEFQMDRDNLRLAWSEESLTLDQFEEEDDGSVKICLDNFKDGSQVILYGGTRRKVSVAETWVSVICTTLSLICLLLSFIVYCVFKPLRSMPGRNNMNLIFVLFFAQLLYLVGAGRTEIKGVCEALAMFIHYFWLAAFCAMNVCSFHMFRVFTSMRSRDDSSDRRRRLLQYSVYIYGIPAVLVAITLVSHIVATDGATTGYGSNGMCYLSSSIAILVAFGVPVAMTVISNSIFFIITLRSIKNRPKIEKSKQEEHHAAAYIKLSTLTGITWTVGFVAVITQIEAFSYLFIIINASQGVFLFISFVCNERVKKLVLECRSGNSSTVNTRSGTAKTNTTVSTVSMFAANLKVLPEKNRKK